VSIPESMTATRTFSPVAKRCASGEMKLFRRVLNGGPPGRRRRLRQREPIIGLRGPHHAVGLQRADHIGDAAPVADPPAVIGRPDQRDLLRFDGRQPMPAREIIEHARGDVGGKSDHDLARHVAPLAGRRHAAAVARVGALHLPGRGAELADRIPGRTEQRVRCPRSRAGDGTGKRIGDGVERRRAGEVGYRALGAISGTDRVARCRLARKREGKAWGR
jgi:hypothetical protein